MLILKGIIIGIGKIVPGVSGSMLAISLGVYEKLIYSINNIFKSFKQNIKFLLKIFIGISISIVLFSNIIIKSLEQNYFTTVFFFIGLILGSFKDIKSNIKKENKFLLFSSLLIVLILGIINIDNNVNINNNILFVIYFFFIGFVDAATTVIPGISGTATLMMLGAYNTLIKSFSTIFDYYYIENNLLILIPFIFGFVLGIFLISKLIEYLFNNYKDKTYSSILGFSISTIIIMFIKCFNSFYTFNNIIEGVLLLLIGFIITKKINHIFNG